MHHNETILSVSESPIMLLSNFSPYSLFQHDTVVMVKKGGNYLYTPRSFIYFNISCIITFALIVLRNRRENSVDCKWSTLPLSL